jgi:hypothetical protein
LAELKPSVDVTALDTLEVALLTALIVELSAEVNGFVAVEALGSSIEGIDAFDLPVKKELPMTKIYRKIIPIIIPGANIFSEACHEDSLYSCQNN